jgi:hypothetical protein
MVPRQTFINKIHELGYVYKDQLKRTQQFRKKGGTHCIFVPMKDLLSDEYVTSTLRQSGVSEDDIQTFVCCYAKSAGAN